MPPAERPGRYGTVAVRHADEAQAKVLDAYHAGVETYAAIGAAAGVSAPTARDWLKRAGVDTSRFDRSHPPEVWASAIEDYCPGNGGVIELCERYRIRAGMVL